MPEHNMALIGIVRIVVLDFLRACISNKFTEKQKAEKHTNCHILCAPSIYHLPMFNVFHLSGTFLVTDKTMLIYYHLNLTAMLAFILGVVCFLVFRRSFNDVFGPIWSSFNALNVLDLLPIGDDFLLATI